MSPGTDAATQLSSRHPSPGACPFPRESFRGVFKSITFVVLCVLLTACGDDDAIGGPALELGDHYLLVSNASFDFQSGSLAAIEIPGLEAHGDLSFLHPDSVIRVSAGRLFAINRLAGDNVQRLDPTTLSTRWQYSVGAGSNPQDVLVLEDGRAYVTRYEETALWVVDTEAPSADEFRIDTIDLGAFAARWIGRVCRG